MGRYI